MRHFGLLAAIAQDGPAVMLLIAIALVLSAVSIGTKRATEGRAKPWRLPLALASLALLPGFIAQSGFPIMPTQAALAASSAATWANTGLPVLRLGYYKPGDAPLSWWLAQSGACSSHDYSGTSTTMADDTGTCSHSGDSNSYAAIIGTDTLDVRQFGAQLSASVSTTLSPTLAAANETAIAAAMTAATALHSCAVLPGGILQTTAVPVTAGDCLNGAGDAQNQNAGAPINGAHTDLEFVGPGVQGFVVTGSSSQELVRLHNLVAISTDAWGSASPIQTGCITYSSSSALALDLDVRFVSCTDFVIGLDCYNCSASQVDNFQYNAQLQTLSSTDFPVPNRINGMPYAGIRLKGGNTQGLWVSHARVFGNQRGSGNQLYSGDGSTTSFAINIGTLEGTYLNACSDLVVSIGGVQKTLGTDYSCQDATPGAPTSTIYAATTTISGALGATSVTLGSASGLPSALSCPAATTGWAFPCDPVIEVFPAGTNPKPLFLSGSYATSISGTTMTMSSGLLTNCSGGCTAIVEETFVASHDLAASGSGLGLWCHGNFSYTAAYPNWTVSSGCAKLIDIVFAVAPPAGTNNIAIYWGGETLQSGLQIAAASGSQNSFELDLSGCFICIDEAGHSAGQQARGNAFTLWSQLEITPIQDSHTGSIDKWDNFGVETGDSYLQHSAWGAGTSIEYNDSGMKIINPPTSCTGLTTGQIYSNSGALGFCP